MCGIVGFIAPRLDGINTEPALKSLAHRGPDASGFIGETSAAHQLWLGHRRLAIIDLSAAGNQPMTHQHVTLIFNGEIYNFEELRRTHLPDQSFHSHTDTEVILKLYIRFGIDFVKMINGDFAISIFDRQLQKIYLVRDRMGIKPFYIYERGGVFAFASEIVAFKAAGLPLSLNENGIGRYLAFKYSPGNETLFSEVRRLTPASILEFNLATGRQTTAKYWELSREIIPFKGSYADAKNQLKHFVEKAVKARLIGDVPIANYLSGGLDSSIIAHYLKGGNNVHFCAVKNQADLAAEGSTSDGYYAAKLAEEWGLDLRQISIGQDTLTEENLRNAVISCGDLIADGSIIPAMLIAKQAAVDHRVVLSGMGADELFLGYNGHFLLRLSQMSERIPGIKPVIGSAMRSVNAGKGPLKAYRRYLQKWGNNMGKDFEAGRYSVVGDTDSALSIFNGDAGFSEFVAPYFPQGKDPFDSLFEFEMENFLVKNLHYLDGSSMAYGLESRVPFLDHELVTFAAGLPTEFKLDWKMKSKKILKEAYANEIPSYVTKRRKAGFGMPLRSLLAKDEVLNRFLPLDYFGDRPYFNADAIKKLIAAHKSGRQDQSALLYALISFRIWEELNF